MKGIVLVLLLSALLEAPWAGAAEPAPRTWAQAQAEAAALAEKGASPVSLAAAKEALALADAQHGPGSREAAQSLVAMAKLSSMVGDPAAALGHVERLLPLVEATPGDKHADLIEALFVHGKVLRQLQKLPEAEVPLKRTLALRQQHNGAGDLSVARAQGELAELYFDMGRFEDAAPLYESSLAIHIQVSGPDSDETAGAINNFAGLRWAQGKMEEALALLRRSHAIREKTAPGRVEVASGFNNIATLLGELGRHKEAEEALAKGLAVAMASVGEDHLVTAALLDNRASNFHAQGDFDQAEALYARGLQIREKVLGPDHPQTARAANNLGTLLVQRGRLEDGEPLLRRSLAVVETVLGPDHLQVAVVAANLGAVYDRLGRAEDAEAMMRKALAITEKSYGANNPRTAAMLNNHGGTLIGLQRWDEARAELERSVATYDATYGPDHFDVVTPLLQLSNVYLQTGRLTEAADAAERALRVATAGLGDRHTEVANAHWQLVSVRLRQGKPDEALASARLATGILRERFTGHRAGAGTAIGEQRQARERFLLHLRALEAARIASVLPAADAAAEAVEVAQLAQASSVGAAVAQMAARFAGRGDALAARLRDQQDLARELATSEQELLAALARPSAERNSAQERELRESIGALSARRDTQAAGLARDFPEYLQLVDQAPMPAAKVAALLAEGEAVLGYLQAEDFLYAWVVTPAGSQSWMLPVTGKELDSQVQFLRARLQPDERGELPALTPATSARLYQAVFAPLAPALKDARRVFVVSDGALQSLPLGLLGADGDWLAKRHAFALLPSVTALRALRSFERGQPGSEPFAGFGDPVLEGKPGESRGMGLGTVFTTRSAGGLADVASLRQAPPLPETAGELRAIAAVLKAPASSLHLREQASETKVKSSDLSNVRFLAFATHGITAGELAGAAEPGLVLTPPPQASAMDDGYLSASEVAQLKLNADWVLLSACNTAAPDGKPGAEGLSGLAKAFLYAGSRALLVSNWPVASEATQTLVTDTVRRYAAQPGQGKPEALQAAMLAMMEQPGTAHPFYWAPFSVVGE